MAEEAQNVYTIYGQATKSDGSAGVSMEVPGGCYQVLAPFGADVGGTNAAFAAFAPDSEFDSWLTARAGARPLPAMQCSPG